MSKQELKKWTNKLKMYIALHPGFAFEGWCGPENKKCPYYQHSCPEKRLSVSVKTWETRFTTKMNFSGPGFIYCFEWVKYV
jgi:hypothetical protein